MTNVYILGLSYTNSSSTSGLSPVGQNISTTFNNFKGASSLEVRTGFFGMCVRQKGVVWLCSADTNGLREQIGAENDPLDLVGTMAHFKDDVLFSGLLFMVVVITFAAFLMLATFPGWREERDERTGSNIDFKPFPSRPVSQAALACCFVAAILLLVSSIWQHVGAVGAAAMADAAFFGNVKTAIGSAAMLLSWIGFAVAAVTTISLFVMIISIIVLDRLTDD
ncbi:hypothetical protein E8E12_007971 [Didymella heteroderae]|uniref:Ca2+ regulator and membrane fusion protein Fig1-domain-containing protein n=1 Tax=Didymella heteroderae TaxID=1769908 RepID=A0A9P4WNW6_9PLEO|nr:hypothetical protein E8E12_007971 [Didymella heteroderae]